MSASASASTARNGSTLAATASALLIVQRVEAAVWTITSQWPDRAGGGGSLPMFQAVTSASGARAQPVDDFGAHHTGGAGDKGSHGVDRSVSRVGSFQRASVTSTAKGPGTRSAYCLLATIHVPGTYGR